MSVHDDLLCDAYREDSQRLIEVQTALDIAQAEVRRLRDGIKAMKSEEMVLAWNVDGPTEYIVETEAIDALLAEPGDGHTHAHTDNTTDRTYTSDD